MTQAEEILAHLKKGHRITALEALEKFGCFRLAARILELRTDGNVIQKKNVHDPKTQKVYAAYWLEESANGRPQRRRKDFGAQASDEEKTHGK